MTSLFNTIIVDNTILFLLTVIGALLFTAFPEALKRGDFSKMKKFFF